MAVQFPAAWPLQEGGFTATRKSFVDRKRDAAGRLRFIDLGESTPELYKLSTEPLAPADALACRQWLQDNETAEIEITLDGLTMLGNLGADYSLSPRGGLREVRFSFEGVPAQ